MKIGDRVIENIPGVITDYGLGTIVGIHRTDSMITSGGFVHVRGELVASVKWDHPRAGRHVTNCYLKELAPAPTTRFQYDPETGGYIEVEIGAQQ